MTRRRIVAGLGVALAAVVLAAPAGAFTQLELGVVADLNAVRAQHHLAPLQLSPQLSAAAREHSQQMAADGYFAHASADGSSFWRRIRRFYAPAARRPWAVGENLLWSSPTVDAARALRLWMASPEHRANILDPRWREVGVAATHARDAPGVYHGLEVTIVTTDFGVRR